MWSRKLGNVYRSFSKVKLNSKILACPALRSIVRKNISTTKQSKIVVNKIESKYNETPLISVSICDSNKYLIVDDARFGQKNTYRYPYVWLRDNCQCGECFHQGSKSRIHNWEEFDIKVYPLEVKFDDATEKIKIVWNNSHESTFTLEWLLKRNFNEENSRDYLQTFYRPQPKLWGKEDFKKILKTFNFNDILNDDNELKNWLEALSIYGVAMIKGTPATEKECRKIANRVGFIRKTHYGEEFIVQTKEGTSNVAYLSAPLQLHTDLPYYEYKPGCNLLHCLVQSKSSGGNNTIADGFYVAKLMSNKYPDLYRLLCETVVNWSDVGEEDGNRFHSVYRAPVICLGRDHQFERINHSVPQRDSYFNVTLQDVELWYKAMSLFVKLLHSEAVSFKTEPGDILTFNNIRMVHGRTGYTDSENNTRHIVGAYLDWDEIYSRLRVLKECS